LSCSSVEAILQESTQLYLDTIIAFAVDNWSGYFIISQAGRISFIEKTHSLSAPGLRRNHSATTLSLSKQAVDISPISKDLMDC